MKELNEQDRERLEQQADIIYDNSPDVLDAYDIVLRLMMELATYEHNYQREQRIESNETIDQILDKVGKDPSGMIYYSEAVAAMELYANQRVEAERSELIGRIEKLENAISDTLYQWKQGDGLTGMMITKLKLILNKKP